MVNVYAAPSADELEPDLEQWKAAFKQYKTTGNPGKRFGRDSPYVWKREYMQANLKHVHVLDDSQTFDKHTTRWKMTSDSILVYCESWSEPGNYAILAVLASDGHDQQNNDENMERWLDAAYQFDEFCRRKKREESS